MPDGRGLGIELHDAALARHRVEDKVLATPLGYDGSVRDSYVPFSLPIYAQAAISNHIQKAVSSTSFFDWYFLPLPLLTLTRTLVSEST